MDYHNLYQELLYFAKNHKADCFNIHLYGSSNVEDNCEFRLVGHEEKKMWILFDFKFVPFNTLEVAIKYLVEKYQPKKAIFTTEVRRMVE